MSLLAWAPLVASLAAGQTGGDSREPVRLLLQRSQDEVLRPNAPLVQDLIRAAAFAASLNRPSVLDRKATRGEAFDELIEGRADLMVTPTPGEGAPELGTSWSKPLRKTDVVVIGRRGGKKPGTIDGLGTVHIARTTDLGPVLAEHFEANGISAGIEAHADIEEPADLLGLVANGAMPHGVVLRDELDDFLAYRDDVEVWFVVRKIPLVWVVRADNEEFLKKLNAFLTRPPEPPASDLDAVKRAGVIRVAMLNNAASYYLDRDEPTGFHYDFAMHLASKLGVRLEVIVPSKPGDMDKLLAQGKADLSVSPFVPESEAPNTAFSKPLMTTDLLLVQPAGEAPIRRIEDLAGKTVVVRRSSQYWPVLESIQEKVPALVLKAADERLETEMLIDLVARKKIPLTAANGVLFGLERRRRSDVQASLVLAKDRPLGYGARRSAKKLLAWVGAFVEKERGGATFERLYDRYFGAPVEAPAPAIVEPPPPSGGSISKFDGLVQKYAGEFQFEWRLVSAQMFVESRFNPKAKSPAGALGLMQVMPRTGASMGYRRLDDPDEGTKAGVQYMRDMRSKFKTLPPAEQLRFAFASYNGGYGHVRDARLLARERGLDPDRWHDNVAKAVLLLMDKAYYSKAKYGYCRGTEVFNYVERIEKKHSEYVKKMGP